ncbi:MAG: helix-turn-helix transcriptional regulator [Phycisphaerales bacterium]
MHANDLQLQFGRRLRQLRLSRGWSQEKFAQIVGLDRTYVGGIERGERNPSLKNIGRFAEALGVPPSDLFDFTEAE